MRPPNIRGTNAIKIIFLNFTLATRPDTVFTVSAVVHRADDVRLTSTSDVTSNTESESDIVVDVNNDIQSVIVIEHDHTSTQATVSSATTTAYFYCMKPCDVTGHDVVCYCANPVCYFSCTVSHHHCTVSLLVVVRLARDSSSRGQQNRCNTTCTCNAFNEFDSLLLLVP